MFRIKNAAIVMSSVLLLSLTSCIKDKYKVDVDDNTNRVIVEFSQGGTQKVDINLNFVAGIIDTGIIELRVPPRSLETMTGDLTVRIVPNATLVADYNTANSTSYTVPPVAAFALQGNVIVIPKSTGVAKLKVKLNPTLIAAGQYAVGYSIAEISQGEISKVKRNVLVSIAVKNKYDGVYAVKGYAFLGANTVAPYLFNAGCSFEIWATSTGPNSIGLDAQPLFRGTPPTTTYGFGNVMPEFVFDLATDKVTAVRPSPFISSTLTPIALNFPYGLPYDSRYDPVTKSIYVKFGVNNNPAWFITDTLVYCGPR